METSNEELAKKKPKKAGKEVIKVKKQQIPEKLIEIATKNIFSAIKELSNNKPGRIDAAVFLQEAKEQLFEVSDIINETNNILAMKLALLGNTLNRLSKELGKSHTIK